MPTSGSRRPRLAFGLVLLLLSPGAPVAGASQSPSVPTIMPAGTQFDDRVWAEVKAEAAADALSVERDGIEVSLGVRMRRGMPTTVATVRTSDGADQQRVTVDDGRRWRAPKGYPSRRGVSPVALAAGPNGFLATGIQHFWDSALAHEGTLEGVIWHSRDGRHWARFDPRTILGQRVSLRPAAIAIDGAGRFFVLADVGGLGMRGVSTLVVLRSSDGRHWSRTATLDARWALGGRSIDVSDDGLRLQAVEYICDESSGAMYSFGVAAQPRVWAGDTDGARWTRVPVDGGGLLVSPRDPPRDAADCPRDLQVRQERYGLTGTLVTLPSGRSVAIDGDVTRAAVDPGTGHWTVGDLEGAVLVDGSPRDIRAATAVEEPDGSVAVLSLETRRHDGVSAYPGMQVVAWRSQDDGATWQQLPATRPILLAGTNQRLVPRPGGSMMLTEQVYQDGELRTVGLTSTRGPFILWQTCQPAAGADCRFATLEDVDVAGDDLAGIDLSGATVTGGDWSRVSMVGARLRSATVETSLAGADLSNADAQSARLGDITDATLTGTILKWATIPFAALGSGARAADLRGAYVASFSDIDLTGALLGKARWTSLTFFEGTICPDGRPARKGVYDETACRLRQR